MTNKRTNGKKPAKGRTFPAGTRVATPDGPGQTISMDMRRASNGGPGSRQYAVRLDDHRIRHYTPSEVQPCD